MTSLEEGNNVNNKGEFLLKCILFICVFNILAEKI
jgi:hypothetical protein